MPLKKFILKNKRKHCQYMYLDNFGELRNITDVLDEYINLDLIVMEEEKTEDGEYLIWLGGGFNES